MATEQVANAMEDLRLNGRLSAPRIRRRFVTLGERQVHYREAGAGPPLVMLHQSPRSSAELVPLMGVLAGSFTTLAPDTPGFGLSDPLAPSDAEPSIDAFADSLAAFLDALGLERAAVYGAHTGAIIATRFAARFPQRVSALVANGVMITTAQEREVLLERYLPHFAPAWDGSHLAWMWSRLRDQTSFYPWFARDPASRIDWRQSLEEMEDGALDLLRAGDDYRGAYRAALDYAIVDDLARLKPPTLLLVAATDALSRSVKDYPPLPGAAKVAVVPDFGDVPNAVLDFLTGLQLPDAGLAEPPGARRHGVGASIVALGDGDLHLRSCPSGEGPPLVVLHDLGGSARALEALLGALAGERPVFAPDLPGHGDSDGFDAFEPDAMARVLLEAADVLGLASFDLVAIGSSDAVARAMARLAPGRAARTVLCDPPAAGAPVPEPLLPDLSADASGSHLFRAWYYLRDRALFRPWFDRAGPADLGLPPRPPKLQQELIDLLKARDGLHRRLRDALGDPSRAESQNAAVLATAGAVIRTSGSDLPLLPDDLIRWAPVVLAALDGRRPPDRSSVDPADDRSTASATRSQVSP